MQSSPAIETDAVGFSYGQRAALREVSLQVQPGEIFALLGPNGGGKSTLFRLLATLIPLQSGRIEILGYCVTRQAAEVRRRVGVVFQSPSVDPKLRVWENVRHQGWLYGLSGEDLRTRGEQLLKQLGLADRARDPVETLSGGLRRRLELAKGMLHRPRVLLMDEPSTGLDPAARGDFWAYLRRLQQDHGVTVLLATHLLEEADKADRVAILSEGSVVANGKPDELCREIGGETITIEAAGEDAAGLGKRIESKMHVAARCVDNAIHIASDSAATLVAPLMDQFGDFITNLRIGRPTLEDVFIARTGHRFWNDVAEDASPRPNKQSGIGGRHG